MGPWRSLCIDEALPHNTSGDSSRATAPLPRSLTRCMSPIKVDPCARRQIAILARASGKRTNTGGRELVGRGRGGWAGVVGTGVQAGSELTGGWVDGWAGGAVSWWAGEWVCRWVGGPAGGHANGLVGGWVDLQVDM